MYLLIFLMGSFMNIKKTQVIQLVHLWSPYRYSCLRKEITLWTSHTALTQHSGYLDETFNGHSCFLPQSPATPCHAQVRVNSQGQWLITLLT